MAQVNQLERAKEALAPTSFDLFWEKILQLRSVIRQSLPQQGTVKILEVGCGSCSYALGIKDLQTVTSAHIVGIDISQEQLDRNPILHERILGDIQKYELPENTFDLIVCWWILEHLEEPEKVLLNCQRALRDGGLLIIALPNVLSIKGLVTKFTPHWFHVWFYKTIFHDELAGTPGNPPFKTFLKFFTAPESVKRFARKNKLSIDYFCIFEEPRHLDLRRKYWLTGWIWGVVRLIAKVLSLGKVNAELTDYIMVLRKKTPLLPGLV